MFEINWVGQTLGAYTIVSKIGQGGMAVVYKAYEPALDRYVAIKILPPSLASEPGFAARFEREARAIARLDHQNILPVYSYGQQSGLSYLVMRFVHAGTLKERMGRPLDLNYVAEIFHQVGDALHYAHNNGIIHRDIKPSNILMATEHWALLTDFGLARMMESASHLTGTGVGVGTPAYMSPEQGQGLEVDVRTDIYSLGIMLYEMVVGKVPYEAETPMAVVFKHISAPLPLPSQARPGLPEVVEKVILKAMAKKPADRFQTAAEFVKALDAAISHSTERTLKVDFHPTSVPGQTEPPATQPVAPDTGQPVDAPTVVVLAAQPNDDFSPPAVPEPLKEPVQPQPGGPTLQTDKLPVASPIPRPGKIRRRAWQIGAVFIVMLVAIALAWKFWTVPAPQMVVSVTGTPRSTPTLLLPTATFLPPVRPSFIIRFVTSSDWASVSFDGAALIKTSRMTSVSGDPIFAERNGQEIRLNQNINSAFVGHQISSTYEVFLADLKPAGMGLSLNAGCLGQSEVEILNAVVEPPVVVFRRAITGCQETSFSVPGELLKADNPIALQRPGPPQPVLPASADTDESKFVLPCPESRPSNQQLCMIKVHSGQLVRLTEDFNYTELGWPAWSGDGKMLYYHAVNPNTVWSSFVINADGTGNKKLVDTAYVNWSPDNQVIAYSKDCILRLMRPDGTDRRYLNTPGVRCVAYLRWAPDSSRLAFADLDNFDKQPPSIWVINRDGANLHRIFQFAAPLLQLDGFGLAWSPDGKSVGVWYQTDQPNVMGLLLDAANPVDPQPIDWVMPIWWTPSFWPQWGR